MYEATLALERALTIVLIEHLELNSSKIKSAKVLVKALFSRVKIGTVGAMSSGNKLPNTSSFHAPKHLPHPICDLDLHRHTNGYEEERLLHTFVCRTNGKFVVLKVVYTSWCTISIKSNGAVLKQLLQINSTLRSCLLAEWTLRKRNSELNFWIVDCQ